MATQTPQLTPAMRQYQQFKQQQPGYVLFFRVGDFYELFADDAELAVRVLGVTVHNLGRPGEKARPVPGQTFRVGVPTSTIEGCLRRMIAAGHKAAICEPDGSGPNHERDRCDMAAATKAKKSDTKKATDECPVLTADSGQALSLSDDERKALSEVLPRFEQMCTRGVISTVCGNELAADAVRKLNVPGT
jgi:hypothetical protein